ncbi:MAG: hypothetical protein IMY72_13095 [Bacteroidetes bacterium]|nr:hypothetical protein [Bacteroidota bacterium]
MKHFRNFIISVSVLIISGCASVPKQVVDAMDVQQEEIKRVKEIYFNNLNNQLDAIEKYRIAIIDIYEEQYISQYSKTLDMVTEGGKTELKETEPTGDKNVDHINLGKLEDLQCFFRSEKEKVRSDIKNRREQIYKANQNFENIEQINTVVNDYLQSLSRLKNSQDKLAKVIKAHVEKLIPIPVSFDNIPDPSTIEDLVKSLNK